MTKPADREIVDLSDCLGDPVVRGLLAQSGADVDVVVSEYNANLKTRVAIGLTEEDRLHGAVVARTPHAGVCEVLAIGFTDSQAAASLVNEAADSLHAVAIWVHIDPGNSELWTQLGFTFRTDPRTGNSSSRGERRHPPEPSGFRTTAAIHAGVDRDITVELPPEGNTLPLIPAQLRDREIPAHVLKWILDADEVGLLLQDLAPNIFPPVTPAVRPPSVRSSLGSLTPVLGNAALDTSGPEELISGLPGGVRVPVRVVEIIAAADRVRVWLLAAQRVQQWAEREGQPELDWITHDHWEPHSQAPAELDQDSPWAVKTNKPPDMGSLPNG